MSKSGHGALFGPLPTRGIWTSLDLTRGQFLFIIALSVGLFVFIDGPLWVHAHESHFWRIVLSYLAIPVAVAAALYWNRKARAVTAVVASIVIALVKLVLTAVILVAIGLAQA
jgi:hypothetical protein